MLLIKSGVYLQKKTSKSSIAFYANINVKHVFKLYLGKYKIQNLIKLFNTTLSQFILQFMNH